MCELCCLPLPVYSYPGAHTGGLANEGWSQDVQLRSVLIGDTLVPDTE